MLLSNETAIIESIVATDTLWLLMNSQWAVKEPVNSSYLCSVKEQQKSLTQFPLNGSEQTL